MEKYLILSAILFSIGTIGVLTKRNAIVIFMCVEMMLNAVNLTFITFSKYLGNLDGQIFVFFVMTVAAAEAAVGLALMIAFYKNRESIDVEDVNLMKW
jgi:NADH-quinone oxidoreductase subunit K